MGLPTLHESLAPDIIQARSGALDLHRAYSISSQESVEVHLATIVDGRNVWRIILHSIMVA